MYSRDVYIYIHVHIISTYMHSKGVFGGEIKEVACPSDSPAKDLCHLTSPSLSLKG